MAGAVIATVNHNHSGHLSHRNSSSNSVATDFEELERQRSEAKRKIEERQKWSKPRLHMYKLISRQEFDLTLGAVIFLNMILVVLETDIEAQDVDVPAWMELANYVLLVIYCAELVVKFYVCRMRFFDEPWNIMDLLIVGSDLVLLLLGVLIGNLPSISILRIFRLVRLVRALRAVSALNELQKLLLSFARAMKACVWGMFLIIFLLTLWGITAVQILNPINQEIAKSGAYDGCDRCSRAYASVFQAALTFFQQLVTGDSWGTVSIPIIEHSPWTAPMFALIMITVSLAMLNLVLAVIVEAATEARAEEEHKRAVEHDLEIQAAKTRLKNVCYDLDTDKSGNLSFEEFSTAFDSNKEFADILMLMGIGKGDIDMLFAIVDSDMSGDVHYSEFVDQLHRLKANPDQLTLFCIAQMQQTLADLRSQRISLHTNATTMPSQVSEKVSESFAPCESEVPTTKDNSTAEMKESLLHEIKAIQHRLDELLKDEKKMTRQINNKRNSAWGTRANQIEMGLFQQSSISHAGIRVASPKNEPPAQLKVAAEMMLHRERNFDDGGKASPLWDTSEAPKNLITEAFQGAHQN